MAARLTQAKKKIVLAGIPLGTPVADELDTRLDDVCRSIYLSFTAAYAPGPGPDLLRSDLATDAVELARVLFTLAPDQQQVRALLALLTLQHARRDARRSDGALVVLAEQDRRRWHSDELDVGLGLVDSLARAEGYSEELRLQAMVAAEHARACTAADTDWLAVAAHHDELERLTGSAVMRLNRAVAWSEVEGPLAGLVLIEGLDELLPGNHRVAAVRAELARRAGEVDAARSSYRAAIAACANDVELAYLRARLEELGSW